jgi:hypothetical protein
MDKASEGNTSAELSQGSPAGTEAVNTAATFEPEGIDLDPEFASLSPELNSWQTGSIAADLSPDITFYDAPE